MSRPTWRHGNAPDVALRQGISEFTHDNHLQAAFCALRAAFTSDADASTGLDHSYWYDLVEVVSEQDPAKQRRRIAARTGKRSNIGGDRSNSEGDRGQESRDGAAMVGVAT